MLHAPWVPIKSDGTQNARSGKSANAYWMMSCQPYNDFPNVRFISPMPPTSWMMIFLSAHVTRAFLLLLLLYSLQ